jgi:hypothetical protein
VTDLSREARELVRLAKDTESSGAGDRARVRAALDARLAIGAGAGVAAASAGATGRAHVSGAVVAKWAVMTKWVVGLGVVAIAAAGAGRYFGARATGERPTAIAQAARPVIPGPTSAPESSDSPTIAVTDLPVAPPSAPARAVPQVRSTATAESQAEEQAVSEELSILLRAQTAMRAGQPDAALAALDEHTRRFPLGALAEERSSERVFALCALGRTDDARSEAAHFLNAFPRSPAAARVRASCGARSQP